MDQRWGPGSVEGYQYQLPRSAAAGAWREATAEERYKNTKREHHQKVHKKNVQGKNLALSKRRTYKENVMSDPITITDFKSALPPSNTNIAL